MTKIDDKLISKMTAFEGKCRNTWPRWSSGGRQHYATNGSVAENQFLVKVASKVEEEWKKRMVKEDRHTIHKYEFRGAEVELGSDGSAEKGREQCGQYCSCFVWLWVKRGVENAFRCWVWKYASAFLRRLDWS